MIWRDVATVRTVTGDIQGKRQNFTGNFASKPLPLPPGDNPIAVNKYYYFIIIIIIFPSYPTVYNPVQQCSRKKLIVP